MKFLIIFGFLLGFGGVLAAAGLAPIAIHERIDSKTSVANNGGRLETFIIRLPADRIASAGSVGPRRSVIDPVTRIESPAVPADSEFMIEQFKLRNIDGEVIGVAMRHWTLADGASAGTWSVSIPSRGTLVWNADGDAPAILSAAIASAGVQSGAAWQGELPVPLTGDQNSGQVVTGTEEFDGSTGFVEEIWDITGVGDKGEIRGTISLNTRVSRSQ
ncbi:MAG: hypothetical protein PVF63_06770 [Gammaproteobacteria bacterium]|jgi:hypothetical protein